LFGHVGVLFIKGSKVQRFRVQRFRGSGFRGSGFRVQGSKVPVFALASCAAARRVQRFPPSSRRGVTAARYAGFAFDPNL